MLRLALFLPSFFLLLATTASPAATEYELLEPDKAFALATRVLDAHTFEARWTIAPGYYMYRDKFKFEALDDTIALKPAVIPPGKKKDDPLFGVVETYAKSVAVRLPIERRNNTAHTARVKITAQGCNEPIGVCYPPIVSALDFPLLAWSGAPADSTAAARVTASGTGRDSTGLLLAMLAAFGTGLLLTFTPCVLPMIPILSSMIVGTGDRHITKLQGGLLSGAYVLGTAATYTVVGVIAGTTGEQLQAYLQNPWALGLFAKLLVGLALPMFGLYELQMPAAVQSLLHKHSHAVHQRTKHIGGLNYLGLFVVGLISALIVGACVSPLFISALGVAIANRDPVLGGAIMFSMALGMGIILLAIGMGAGFLLPKAGPWMERVKQVFGVLLIAVAIYLLGLLPEVPVLFLWAALFIVCAVYLGATQSLPAGVSGWRYLWKGTGTVLLVWGVLALLGGLVGNRDILNPLPLSFTGGAVSVGAPATQDAHLFERVRTLAELEGRLSEAKAAGKPVTLDYYADWCTDCLRMEKATFAGARVRAELARRFVLLQADVTDPTDAEVKAIKQRFGIFGPPAMLFFDARGEERRELRAYGFRSPEEFLALERQVDKSGRELSIAQSAPASAEQEWTTSR